MATYYWVGGSGTWDTINSANWASSSGGSGGAGIPTSADDVIFDAGSNVGTGAFTVTVSGASCRDFSTGGAGGALDGAMTLAMGTSSLFVHGSFTLPATNFAFTASTGAQVRFVSTVAGNTVTTNGVTFATVAANFDGVGGSWTLGSALTTTGANVTIVNGTFDTSASNYSVSCSSFASTGTGAVTINLNGSTVTASASGGITFSNPNLTFNAGTSTIICSGANSAITSAGYTFNNVSFTSAGSGTITISGVNTYNNLTFTTRSATGVKALVFTANQTVNGTLTFGAANTAIRRYHVFGTTFLGTGVGTPITLTVATLATLADVDFRDITAAGASAPWSGTRIGNGGGNSNITFTAGATKYWNLAGGGNWSATAWALGSGGAVSVNNFPLAQDTVVIEDTGLNSGATITVDAGWFIPNIGASTRTLAFTFATGSQNPIIFGDFNIPSVTTVTGTASLVFGANNKTQLITTNGVTLTQALLLNGSTNNVVRLAGNVTSTSTANNTSLVQGTLDLNNFTLTSNIFASNQSVVRTLAFGTGNITVTGNALTVVSMTTVTNLTITGTPVFNATYSGSTGTRTFSIGNIGESGAISINVTAGSDTVSFATTNGSYKNIVMTGFSGIMSFANSINIYGNLTLSATQTVNTGSQTVGFAATSGTQTITTNGVTFNRAININCTGATVQLGDALTLGSTLSITLTAGTFTTTASNYNVTAGSFSSNNANVRTLSLNGSTVTIQGTSTAWNITDSTNLTLNAGTSSLVFTGNTATVNFYGGGKTYYNITLPTDIYTFTFLDENNTFNNVTCTRTTTGAKSIVYRPFTVNGTLTLTGSSGNQQILLRAAAYGTPQILTAAAVSFTDVIFRDIDAAGAAIPWTGTRLGDAGGNTDITFAAPKTVYWNKVAGGSWYDDAWATSSGGATATTNQPLPQDTAIFDNTGINAGSTITTPVVAAEVGALDCSTLTNAITFDTTNAGFSVYKNVTLSFAVTFSGAFNINCNTPPSTTQLIDISAATINVSFSAVPRGTCRLASALTISGDCIFAAGGGTFDLNDFKITCGTFNIFADTLNRTLAFGTGSIDVTGNNATVWNAADLTNFSYTGTPTVNFTYAGSTGTRTITNGSTAGGTEANAVDFNITAGSDITTQTAGSIVRNFNCTGYSGAGGLFANGYIYGNLTLSATQTITTATGVTTFAATSGTKTITTNGVTIPRRIVVDGAGGTFQLGDALTQTTYTFFMANGTFNTNNYNLTTTSFNSNYTNTRAINFGSSTVTIASISGDVLTFGTSPTTGLTFNAGTSNIVIVSTGDRTFKGAGETFNTVTLNTAFKTTFQGTGTKFRTLTNTTSPTTAEFEAGSTFYFNNFTLSGTSGNLVTIQSSVPTTQFTLNKVTGGNVNVSFCSITDSAASPAGYWYAPTSSGNVDGGNNTGWNFATGLSTGNGFMMFF